MPTFDSFKAYERELARFQAEFERTEKKRITEEQAAEAQKIAERAFSKVLGGDAKFSGWEPVLETQVKPLRDGASLLMPTKTSAGPITVAFEGRNRGGTTAFLGPGANRNTGATARNQSTGAVRKVRKFQARRWNGYTDPKLSPADIRDPAEERANAIAEKRYRKALQKHFDVD